MTRYVMFMMLAGLLMLGRSAMAADAPSLIANGDFETDANADGVPDGWPKVSDNVMYENDGGNHFLRLKVTEPDKMNLVYRLVDVPADAKGMVLSFRVKYKGIKVGSKPWFDGRIMMNFKDADKKVLKPAPSPPYFRGTKEEWQSKSVKFTVPEGAKTLEIMPCLFNAAEGTLDFDDFALTVMSGEEAAAMMAEQAAAAAAKAEKEAAQEKKVDEKLALLLEQTGNLIVNGDFETANKQGDFAEGWGHKTDDGKLSWLEEGGDHFVRIVSQEPDSIAMLYRLALLPRDVKGLKISLRYRTSGVQKGSKMPADARVIFHFQGGPRVGHTEYGDMIGPDPRAMGFSSSAKEWTEISQECLVPAGATKLQVMPGLWFAKAGTVDVTEIKITAMAEADAVALAAKKEAAAKEKSEREQAIQQMMSQPAKAVALKTLGNQIVTAEGEKPVWLQGLSVDSMQWSMGENILWSIHVAIDEWHANVIRLAVSDKFWYGQGKGQPAGSEGKYRQLVDDAVKLCASKGAYLVLDLHNFGAPMAKDATFWKDAAERYKNNPAVLFELFNEPHGISWKLWRDGGDLEKDKHQDVNVTENNEKVEGRMSVGMQALVDAVRSTGAKNIVIAGGLDWSYNISGIIDGYALDDKSASGGGDGIIYVAHIYPWKKGWQKAFLNTAEKYPVIVTEVGAIDKWSDFSFIGEKERYPLDGWAEDVVGMMQKYKLNWTGFSFHPRCGPMIISDWNYTPTPYWGVYVKRALAGEQFEMKKMR